MNQWISDLIAANPGVVQAIGGVVVVVVGIAGQRFYAYLKQLVGEQEAKLIVQRAVEQVCNNADIRVNSAEALTQEDQRLAAAFREGVEQVKAVARNGMLAATDAGKRAMTDGVATVDKKKATPIKVLGWLGRAAWWVAKKKVGL